MVGRPAGAGVERTSGRDRTATAASGTHKAAVDKRASMEPRKEPRSEPSAQQPGHQKRGPAEFGRIIERDRAHYGRIVAEGNLAKQP